MDDKLTLKELGEITRAYYSQTTEGDYTEETFKLWLDSLSPKIREYFKSKGLKECRGVLNYQRFVLELRDTGLDEYLKDKLTPDQYERYKSNME